MSAALYSPPQFFTLEVLADVLGEFSWPSPFTLVDDLPDGIEIHLPHCHLYAMEGFESEMNLKFLPESTGLDELVSIGDAIRVLASDRTRTMPPEPKLVNFFAGHASLEKVQAGLHDLLTLLFTYFRPSLDGDFSWVASYRALIS
jgi:hypothetical protein